MSVRGKAARAKDDSDLLWMKFNPSDYLLDEKTLGMNEEEHGVYFLLLCHGWRKRLPSDLDAVAEFLPGGRAVLDRCWQRVSKCFRKKGSSLINKRQEHERAEARRLIRSRRLGAEIANQKRSANARRDAQRTPTARHNITEQDSSPPTHQRGRGGGIRTTSNVGRAARSASAGPGRAAAALAQEEQPISIADIFRSAGVAPGASA